MRIGIFGGTFNPVHNGHLAIARCFFDEMALDRLLFIPNNISPFKADADDLLDSKHRLKMLELALENEKDFEIDSFEIKSQDISYTFDTIEYLKSKYPTDKLYLLIGTDQALDFDNWKNADKIREKVLIVVAKRAVERTGSILSKPEFKQLSNAQIDISSSQIIDNIRSGKSIIGKVPDKVIVYIVKNMLYL